MIITSNPGNVPLSLSLKAQAYSFLAKAWFDQAYENMPALQIDRLYDAGNCANEAAALGLISPAVLMVASKIESDGSRRPGDNKFPGHSTDKFERLTDLWEALDVRTAEVAEESVKRGTMVSKDPLSYFCAAEGCGIAATRKSTLQRCEGGCPPAFKPSYCSKYCKKVVCFLLNTMENVVHPPPCRTANIIDRSADQTLQNRVFAQPTVQGRPLLNGHRTCRRVRGLKGPNLDQSGLST